MIFILHLCWLSLVNAEVRNDKVYTQSHSQKELAGTCDNEIGDDNMIQLAFKFVISTSGSIFGKHPECPLPTTGKRGYKSDVARALSHSGPYLN